LVNGVTVNVTEIVVDVFACTVKKKREALEAIVMIDPTLTVCKYPVFRAPVASSVDTRSVVE
jgi:hypothetical protein